MMTVLRAADRQALAWKNGGGVTREIAVFPPGASTTQFDWRLSLAEVEKEGPFSVFPEVDRILAVIEGTLELTFDDQTPSATLRPRTASLAFPGDVGVSGKPLGGRVRDLNLMVRRGRFIGSLNVFDGPCSLGPPQTTGTVVLLLALAPTRLQVGDDTVTLGRLDALLLQPSAQIDFPLRCNTGTGFVVSVTDHSGG